MIIGTTKISEELTRIEKRMAKRDLKNKVYFYLSILRDNSFIPEFIRDKIDDIRYSDFFKEQWYYEY